MATFLGLGAAFWLGIQTAIAPCPMATNIAAISFIGRRVGHARDVLLAGLLYTLGRIGGQLQRLRRADRAPAVL
ncbi:MAG: hypothetical protein ABIP48_26755 [Planctomycetota bacterium]